MTTSFYVINKRWTADRIRHLIRTNSSKDIGSLFLIDRRIMPIQNQGELLMRSDMPDWLEVLRAFAKNVFVYDPDESYAIRLWQLTWDDYNLNHKLYIGDVVDFSALRVDDLRTESVAITGSPDGAVVVTFSHFGQRHFVRQRQQAAERERQREQARNRQQRRQQGAGEDWTQWSDFGAHGNFDDFFKAFFRRNQQRNHQQGRNRYGSTERSRAGDYTLIGAKPDDDNKTLKKAYRKTMMKWHPDLHPDNVQEATEKTQAINAAWERIKQAKGI